MTTRFATCALPVLFVCGAALANDGPEPAPHPLASRTIVLDSPGDQIIWERSSDLSDHLELLGSHRAEQVLAANGWVKVGSTPMTAPSQVSGFPFPENEYVERSVGFYYHPGERRSVAFELALYRSRLPSNAYVLGKVSLRLLTLESGGRVAIESGALEDEHLPWRLTDAFAEG